MNRTGLFGGSFNPIHSGHLHLAKSVRRAMKLDRVMLMPTAEAPHKASSQYAPAMHRLAMCRLAAEPYPWMDVSDFEITRGGKSYTVETLRHLTAAAQDTAWTLMIGSDMLLSFDRWYCWEEILGLAAVCAVSRSRGDLPALRQAAADLTARCPGAEITVLSVRAVEISSTQIRENLQKNADCSCLLPENVVQYIYRNGLYRRREEDEQIESE